MAADRLYAAVGDSILSVACDRRFAMFRITRSTAIIVAIAVILCCSVQGMIQHVKPGGSGVPPFDCWDNASGSIQAALDACSGGDTVLVRPGTYTENISWPLTDDIFLVSSRGADVTIIDGSTGGSSVIELIDVPSATIGQPGRGFTITGGSAVGGGGIDAQNSIVAVSGNIITDNEADNGGGVQCFGPGTSVELRYNQILANEAVQLGAGVSVQNQASLVATNNLVTDNYNRTYEGGGFFI